MGKLPALQTVVYNHMHKGVLFSFILLAALVAAGSASAAFVDPSALPPGGTEVAPPLNTSDTSQTKKGNLTLDGTSPVRLQIGGSTESNNQICLNGVCLTSLSAASYLRLQGSTGTPTPGTSDSGFVSVQAKPQQQYALRVQGSEPTATGWTTGLLGVASTASTGAGDRYGVFGRTNYDSLFSYGVYGYAEFDNAYAGYFEGRAWVTGDLLISPHTNDAGDVVQSRICLNDDGSGNQCITQWPFAESEQFVRLQKTDTPTQDAGSLHVSGSGTFSSVVLGTAAAETPREITCGDGVCQGTLSNPDEDEISCSQDCFTIQGLSLQVFVTSAVISWNTGVQATTGEVDWGLSTFYTEDMPDPSFSTSHGPLTLSGLIGNTWYYYRVISISESGAVAAQTGSFKTLAVDSLAPSKVNNLRVNGSVTWNSVPLAWDPATDNIGILHYLLERNDGSGYVQLGGPITATTFIDTTVSASTTYNYRVRAVDTALNEGQTSDPLPLTTPAVPADTSAPSVPTNVNHSGQELYNNIQLTWTGSTDSGPGASGMKEYNVYRKLTSEPDSEWKLKRVVTHPTVNATDTGPLVNNASYDYAVTAVDNASNESARSATHTLIVDPDTTAPTTPSNIFLNGLTTTLIGLRWNTSTDAGGSGLAGYRLYRYDCTLTPHPTNDWNETCGAGVVFDAGNPAWVLLNTTSISWVDDTIFDSGRQYRYAVVAYDNAGNVSAARTKDVYAPYNSCSQQEQCNVPNSATPQCCVTTNDCQTSCGTDNPPCRDCVPVLQ